MNASLRSGLGKSGQGRATRAGYTLTEVMITMTLVMMIMAAVLSCHLFGMRLFEVTRAKLGASDEARASVGRMVTEVRAAKLVRVGSGGVDTFVPSGPNTRQAGNALQIHPTADPAVFVRYFRDPADSALKRTTNGWDGATVVAESITNEIVFSAEDFSGRVLTNSDSHRVVGVNLQFFQLQYPAVPVGPGQLYDFYQLRTRITRRAVD